MIVAFPGFFSYLFLSFFFFNVYLCFTNVSQMRERTFMQTEDMIVTRRWININSEVCAIKTDLDPV